MSAYSTYTDSALITSMRGGDQEAYRALYTRHWEKTYNTIYKRLKDHSQAEDSTQDIFLQLWVKRADQQIDNLAAYLFGAARNSVYRAIEKQGRFIPIIDQLEKLERKTDHADAQLLTLEFMKAYEALVDALPEGQKTIFRMRYHEDLSPEQIADTLHLSQKTVRNQLGKALATLRVSLTMVALLMTMNKW